MKQAAQCGVLPYRDRAEGGRLLASALAAYAGRNDAVVLALPRGGIPVAFEVARALAIPLDLFVVRKLGAPGNPELAIGAVAPGEVCILQEEIIAEMEISAEAVAAMAGAEQQARLQSEALYRRCLPPHPIADNLAIVVDDGIATGSTMRAAVGALRRLRARAIVVAAPVAPLSTCRELEALADQVVCLATPGMFFTVGQWYVNFDPVSDLEMAALLEQAATLV